MTKKKNNIKSKKLKPLSKNEHCELANHVDQEGFYYYMVHYGPDHESLERLGINTKELYEACEILEKAESKIMKGLEFEEELND